jgi:hypothetical protein
MGRTVPSFRMLLEEIVMELSGFRRALRGEDRFAFDSLMNKARAHASSCTVVPLIEPMDAVFLSILVEQEKEINALKVAITGKTVSPTHNSQVNISPDIDGLGKYFPPP